MPVTAKVQWIPASLDDDEYGVAEKFIDHLSDKKIVHISPQHSLVKQVGR